MYIYSIFKIMKLTGIFTNLLGNKNGLLSLISEKTGKISFKRSAGIILLTAVAIPDFEANGLTVLNLCLMIGVLITVALPKLMDLLKKDIKN